MVQLTLLSKDDVHSIHDATLRILSDVGILVADAEARTLLLDHGAREHEERICIPPDLVETCLSYCPKQVTLRGRGSQIVLGTGELHVHNMGGAREVLDWPDENLRPATSNDLATSTRLLDALENVSTITPLYTPRDVPPSALAVTMFDQTVRHTLKPVNGPGVQTREEVRSLAEMAHVALGDASAISLGVSPVSPLNFPADIAGAMVEIARQGTSFGPLPCPQLGVSAPMSLAGGLAQQNAEVLASIVLVQLVKPGLPVVYCGRLATVDMRTALPNWGNPEIALVSAATVQIGHHYNLPVNVYGLAGSGQAIDIQCGYERAINAVVPALAGADELSGVGEMSGGTFASNAQIVIDNEIMGMVHRVRRGFAVNDDTLAVELLGQVMNNATSFLADPHTVKYLRAGEVWRAKLGVQGTNWQGWCDAGRPTVIGRAQAEALRILAEHEVPPLTDDQSRALNDIVQAATKE